MTNVTEMLSLGHPTWQVRTLKKDDVFNCTWSYDSCRHPRFSSDVLNYIDFPLVENDYNMGVTDQQTGYLHYL